MKENRVNLTKEQSNNIGETMNKKEILMAAIDEALTPWIMVPFLPFALLALCLILYYNEEFEVTGIIGISIIFIVAFIYILGSIYVGYKERVKSIDNRVSDSHALGAYIYRNDTETVLRYNMPIDIEIEENQKINLN